MVAVNKSEVKDLSLKLELLSFDILSCLNYSPTTISYNQMFKCYFKVLFVICRPQKKLSFTSTKFRYCFFIPFLLLQSIPKIKWIQKRSSVVCILGLLKVSLFLTVWLSFVIFSLKCCKLRKCCSDSLCSVTHAIRQYYFTMSKLFAPFRHIYHQNLNKWSLSFFKLKQTVYLDFVQSHISQECRRPK